MSEVPAIARVYVANSGTQDLSVFALAASGALANLGSVPIQRPAVTGRSVVLALSQDASFLYAGYASGPDQPRVATFSLAPSVPLPVRVADTPLADSVAYLATDRSGRFLLGASYAGNQVMVHAIDASGAVGGVTQVVATESKAHCILPDPSNRHVLHTSLGGDLVYQQLFDAGAGRLTPNEPPSVHVRAKSGPRFLCFAPNARVLYLIGELDGSITVFPFNAERGLLGEPLQITSALPPEFTGTIWAADIHVRPDGRFLYVCERTSSTLSAFSVDPDSGALTRIASYSTVKQPRAFDIDPGGRFLVCSGQLANAVIVYAIHPELGTLTPLAEYPVGGNPTWVSVVALD
jgi:6-phosphogluconolactonase